MADKARTFCMITGVDAEELDSPLLLTPDAAWIGIQFYFPEDIAKFKTEAPEILEGGPDFGPEDNMVTVVHNNIEVEDVRETLKRILQSMEATE